MGVGGDNLATSRFDIIFMVVSGRFGTGGSDVRT